MKHLKYLLLFIGLAIFASCSDSDVQGLVGNGNEAAFSGHIGELQTRVTDNAWDAGDEIGIFAVKPAQELDEGGIFDGKNNVKYVADGKGKFSPAGAPIMFPESGSLDFISYYPFQNAATSFVYNIDIARQANPAAIDLLYSKNAVGESGDNPLVKLVFKHMLSRLVFDVTLEEGLSFDDGFSVAIKDIIVDGSFDLNSGEVALGTTKNKITPVVKIAADKKTANVSSIVVPSQNLSDVTVVFSLGGKDYEWTPYAQILESTTKYTYKLKLVIDESGIPVVEELEVGATIEDWVVGNTGGGEIVLAPTGDTEEPVEGEYKTIEQLRTMYADSGEEAFTITEALELKAVVISDRVGGNSTSLKNGYIQDEAGNGLGFRTTEDHEFNLGEELIIDLEGAVISVYGEALQLGFAPAKATVNDTDVAIAPKNLTIEQVLDGMYDGVLVRVMDVQFKNYEGHTYYEGTFSAHNHAIENENAKTIDVRTAKYAEFAADALPKGSGDIVGIMTVFNGNWQVYPRNNADLAEMSDDVSTRFGDDPVDPGEPGDPVDPDSDLLFPGSDFNDWATFTGALNSYGVTFGKESATGGREGSGAMQFEGQYDERNAYVFTAVVPEGFSAADKTKITFWVKGTSVKSLSMNVYVGTGGQMGTDYKCYNMDEHNPYVSHQVLAPTDANSYAKGGINTNGEWVKVTLDISSLASEINSTPGDDLFALKIGKEAVYDLFVDDITIE